jgi:3-oxoacyl-[acyl-carrier-protein] synthase-1
VAGPTPGPSPNDQGGERLGRLFNGRLFNGQLELSPGWATFMTQPMQPLAIAAYTATSALGRGNAMAWDALVSHRSGLRPNDFADAALPTWIGRVDGLEAAPLQGRLAPFDCRNNRLAVLALHQDGFADAARRAVERYGGDRIGVFLGTSTSGIRETETAYLSRAHESDPLPADLNLPQTHGLFSVVRVVQTVLDVSGPALTISTACSSSAKVFASAQRAIRAGLCDAAIVGGVDTLCLTTLHGFHALNLVSAAPCRPWDAARDGINIGEAGGFALLERRREGSAPLALLGYGESSDAHHMTAPHPQGLGALKAMTDALDRAGLAPRQVEYLNLHGTATPTNDAAEDQAVTQLFGPQLPCSSTKGWTGHTLGAAGIVEAVLTLLCVERGMMPATLNLRVRDPALHAGVLEESKAAAVRVAMSNSFGFGGNNCSLLFGRGD